MSGGEPAMAAPQWSITSKKRKNSPTVVFSGRERQCRDETPSTARIRQQTLTQAQWMDRSSSTLGDADMTPIGPAAKPHKIKSRKKRESTLTQMDFFARDMSMETDVEGLTMIPNDVPHGADPSAQLDGTYESPRRPRKRKARAKLKAESKESQNYQPSQRTRGADLKGTTGVSELRRSTRRNAGRSKILSDPTDNFDYFNQALAVSQTPSVQRTTVLEIQDSAEDDYDPDIAGSPPRHGLRTPGRPGTAQTVVKSSQSPESLPPSTKRKERNATEQRDRSPLAQRSANARPALRVAETVPEVSTAQENMGLVTQSGLKRRKHQHKSTVADSQTNLWSVPPTSSPEELRNGATSRTMPNTVAAGVRASASDQYPVEIPSTSQADDNRETDEYSRSQRSAGVSESVEQRQQSAARQESCSAGTDTFPTVVQPALASEDKTATNNVDDTVVSEATKPPEPTSMPPSATPKTVRRSVVEDTEDEHEDFGSPILNDTQYNEEVKQRTSSPAVPEHQTSSRPGSAHSDPIPTPRLVQQTNPEIQSQYIESDENSDSVSLPPAPPPTAVSYGITTRVPLNDIQSIPTSSPSDPSMRSTTQRSVRPASMPHPSQISTQEATQGYLGSSFMPFETPRASERITIKDSSSIRLPMSQIPSQLSQSQLNIDLGVDTLDEGEDDYDLDPPSSAPSQNQPVAKTKKHLPDEIPTERIVSSSPVLSTRSPKRKIDNDLVETVSPQSTATAAPTQSQEQVSTPARARIADHANDAQRHYEEQIEQQDEADENHENDHDPPPPSSSASQPASLSTQPAALARPLREYTQLPGFNNETQSNFTQDGHVSAAYVHRQREAGLLPKWYTPRPFKVPGYTRR